MINMDVVKCPECGQGMEKEFLGSPRYISWLKNEKDGLINSETIVHDALWTWEKNKMFACRCKACKIVIFKYPEMNRNVDF